MFKGLATLDEPSAPKLTGSDEGREPLGEATRRRPLMTATNSMSMRARSRRYQLNDITVNDPSTETHKPPSQIFLSAAIAEHLTMTRRR